jgi:hypothetical protein
MKLKDVVRHRAKTTPTLKSYLFLLFVVCPGVQSAQRGNESMVKCWSCKHLKTIYRGRPADGKLFEKELYGCDIVGKVFKLYQIDKERECEEYKTSKRLKL